MKRKASCVPKSEPKPKFDDHTITSLVLQRDCEGQFPDGDKDATRMHSSRMRTARLLPVSPSMHCSGGTWSQRVYRTSRGCTWSWGYLVPGGACGPRVYWSRGCTWSRWVYLVWGVYLPRYSPPWTEFLTHASENITLPQTSFAGSNYIFSTG